MRPLSDERIAAIKTGWMINTTGDNDELVVAPPMSDYECDLLIAQGYRRVSHRYGIVVRIDRPDWMAVLELEQERDLKFGDGRWESYYRRCLSDDKIELGQDKAARIPSADWDKTGYIPREGDPKPVLLRPSEVLNDRIQRLGQQLLNLRWRHTYALRAHERAEIDLLLKEVGIENKI